MGSIKVSTGASNGYSFGGTYESRQEGTVDVKDEESLKKWSYVLGITKSELVDAVKEFGPIVRNIRRGLNSSQDNQAA